jgi:hypothetical protein
MFIPIGVMPASLAKTTMIRNNPSSDSNVILSGFFMTKIFCNKLVANIAISGKATK